MKRFITVFAALVILAGSNAFSGSKGDVSGMGHLMVAFPTGDFGDVVSTGFGVQVYGAYYVADNLAVNASTGFIYFGNGLDDRLNYEASATAIPLMVGGFYEFRIPRQQFLVYAGLDIGIHVVTLNLDYENELAIDVDDTETEFAISPKFGVFYPIQKNLSVDAGVKIAVVNDAGHINLQAGIKYFFDLSGM